jgi:peptide/nickel transport system permease protein
LSAVSSISAIARGDALAAAPRGKTVRRFIRRNGFFVVGLTICFVIAMAALIGPYLTPYDPAKQSWTALLQSPSWSHPLGTDDLGRDELSRLLTGARMSLLVAVVSALGACFVGGLVGLAAGYLGGWTESILMRLMDALYAFPALVLAIAIVGTLGSGAWQAMVAIAVVAVPRFARLMRAQTLGLRRADFVIASQVAGAGPLRIAVRHILPNAVGVVIVVASSTAGFAVLTEASLSFLGLGVRPPTPAWGSMLKSGYQFLDRAPWLAVAPGAAISLLVLGFNLLGDGLRDLLDPRSR